MSGATMRPSGGRLVRFVITGAGANLLLLALTYLFRSSGMAAFAAGSLGYAIAFVAAYTVQRNWTFGGAHSHRRALPRYMAAQAICAAAAGAVGQLCVSAFGATPFWMSVAVTATAGATSFLLSSFWVFPGEGSK